MNDDQIYRKDTFLTSANARGREPTNARRFLFIVLISSFSSQPSTCMHLLTNHYGPQSILPFPPFLKPLQLLTCKSKSFLFCITVRNMILYNTILSHHNAIYITIPCSFSIIIVHDVKYNFLGLSSTFTNMCTIAIITPLFYHSRQGIPLLFLSILLYLHNTNPSFSAITAHKIHHYCHSSPLFSTITFRDYR